MAPSDTFLRLKSLGANRKSAAAAGDVSVDGVDESLPSCVQLEKEFGLFNPEGGCAPEAGTYTHPLLSST
jgi:hypothetical protein